MYFIYVLQSEQGNHWYFGITNDLKRRLAEHNLGKSIHSNKYKPWALRFCVSFSNRSQAETFERYLKSHTGRAWMSKHLSHI